MKENASKEEIRSAYRELVKKYHPDKYLNNPLADLAEEKLKEINEAYEYLMQNTRYTRGKSEQEPFRPRSASGNHQSSQKEFQQVRHYIQMGNYDAAYNLLQKLDPGQAEWHFLSGLISMRRGWYQQATEQVQTALRMNPGNREYQNVLNNMYHNIHQYQGAARQRGYQQNNNDLCRICTCLYCSDCCCECFGGDLIGCC